jgi:cytidine deaminase
MSTVTAEKVADLRERAIRAAEHSYSPYSGYPVGVAAIDEDGLITTGCNIECASFGMTLCAESVLIGKVVSEGRAVPTMIACRHADGATLMPCGRCRQMLFEHFGPDCLIDQGPGEDPVTVGDLLPHAWAGLSDK